VYSVPLTITQNSGKKAQTHEQRKSPCLSTIPFEIAVKIFKKLGPVYSACAGVTCRHLYTVHRSLWPIKIRLNLKAAKEKRRRSEELSVYLSEWMEPLVYDIVGRKFVTLERILTLKEEREYWAKRNHQQTISYSQEAWLNTYARERRIIYRNKIRFDGLLIGEGETGAF
jgi:hypothetical protein